MEKAFCVLLIDDDRPMRIFYEDCLKEMNSPMGMDVHHAADGEHGLHLMARKSPELVIVDFHMPRLTGAQFCAEARRRSFEGKIIMVTGEPRSRVREDLCQSGILYYIQKPIDMGSKFLCKRFARQLQDYVMGCIGSLRHQSSYPSPTPVP